MDLNLELLSIQNPWWTLRNDVNRHQFGLKFDPIIEQYLRQPLKWRPEILNELKLGADKIYCLCGFKGVGKTTLVKLIIKKLIEEDKINPNNLFFYSCHNLFSYEQLNEMIKLFINSGTTGKGRRYVFIDEVGLIKNWLKGLDYINKAGMLKNTSMVLLSSSAEGIKSGGQGVIGMTVNSLTYPEVVNLINPALLKKITPKNYRKWFGRLEYYSDIYFLTGGFISAINNYQENGAVRQGIYSNFLYWFLAYVARSGRDITLTRQITEKLILNLGRPLGFQTLTHKTKAKTHLTAAEYLNLLENMFVVKTVYQAQNGQPTSRKAKKVYFQDPFLFWLFYSYIHGSLNYWQFSRERLHDPAIFSALVENVVFSHLIKDETIASRNQRVTYWRDSVKKTEINFLLRLEKKTIPILIRYNKEISDSEKHIFEQAGFRQGLIISHNQLDLSGKIKIMPLTYFLLFYKEFLQSQLT